MIYIIIINIIAVTICKYTLPKKFINNNFKTYLLILALITSILATYIIFYQNLIVLSSKTKHTSIKENELSLQAQRILDVMNSRSCNSTSLNYVMVFILIFIKYIIRFFILGYIVRYFYPDIENNYYIFSMPLVIL